MLNKNTKIKAHHKYTKTRKLTNTTTNNIIKQLTIYKLKNIYTDIINDKYKYKATLLQFVFNYYLLLKGYRNIFQIMCKSNVLREIKIYILNKYKIKYITKSSNILFTRLIIYNDKTFNINDIDTTFGKKFAIQLGDFYVCARKHIIFNSSLSLNNKHHITINISKPNLTKTDKTQFIFKNIQLYAQMCFSINEKQINKLKQIAKDISIIIKQFDKKCIINLNITDFHNLISNKKNIIFNY